MANDMQDAKELASELWQAGSSKTEIVQALNSKFENTFFQTLTGIYARNEPDYLPEIRVLTC